MVEINEILLKEQMYKAAKSYFSYLGYLQNITVSESIANDIAEIIVTISDILKSQDILFNDIIKAIQSSFSLDEYHHRCSKHLEELANLQDYEIKENLLEVLECAFNLKAFLEGDSYRVNEYFFNEQSLVEEQLNVSEHEADKVFIGMIKEVTKAGLAYIGSIIDANELNSIEELADELKNKTAIGKPRLSF